MSISVSFRIKTEQSNGGKTLKDKFNPITLKTFLQEYGVSGKLSTALQDSVENQFALDTGLPFGFDADDRQRIQDGQDALIIEGFTVQAEEIRVVKRQNGDAAVIVPRDSSFALNFEGYQSSIVNDYHYTVNLDSKALSIPVQGSLKEVKAHLYTTMLEAIEQNKQSKGWDAERVLQSANTEAQKIKSAAQKDYIEQLRKIPTEYLTPEQKAAVEIDNVFKELNAG
jgi:hypothetical protein